MTSVTAGCGQSRFNAEIAIANRQTRASSGKDAKARKERNFDFSRSPSYASLRRVGAGSPISQSVAEITRASLAAWPQKKRASVSLANP